MKITEKQAYEERIQTLLRMKEANFKAYEELDKKIHEFSMWLEVRAQYHLKKGDIFEGSELHSIQEKFDDLFFSVEAIASFSSKPTGEGQ